MKGDHIGITYFMLCLALFAFAVLFLSRCKQYSGGEAAQPITPSRIERIENFASAYVQPRNLDIYLPAGYDSTRAYAVLYMHDGQNLFHPEIAYGGREWGLDEALDSLGYDLIVVGIWNSSARYMEYMPAQPYDLVPAAHEQARVLDSARFYHGEIQSDVYLSFIVEELKPWIDQHYSSKPGPEHTYIAGSSMGGLISCYALGEYPQVFGAAACLSTHLPALDGVFNEYLGSGKPAPLPGLRLWMDHGTLNLDSTYAPFQQRADDLLQRMGWGADANFVSRVYRRADHNESSWRARLPEVLAFLIRGTIPAEQQS